MNPLQADGSQPLLPPPGRNNLWYHYSHADTTLVFVHGVLSDSRACWLRSGSNGNPDTYWPELIRKDPRLPEMGIYLGGYYTAIDAGAYDVRNCAYELFSALGRPDENGRSPVMQSRQIIFICHSTGGIVARYVLDKYSDHFKSKRIGLVLIASPSYGARWADRLSFLVNFYNHSIGAQLRWGNWSLKELDASFKDLVNQRKIPELLGIEAYENHFIFHRRFLPNRQVIVTEESAGRYFGAPVMLRDTDHFTSVKPDNLQHPAHQLIVDFALQNFATQKAHNPSSATKLIPSYFCYISHEKVDQLFEQYNLQKDTRTSNPLHQISIAGMISNTNEGTYGRPDYIQGNASLRQEYVRKLLLTMKNLQSVVMKFDEASDPSLHNERYFWASGKFAVKKFDQVDGIVTLATDTPKGPLLLDCSLRYFSSTVGNNGNFTLNSANYGFFREKRALDFSTVFIILSHSSEGYHGSPLYLELKSWPNMLAL